MANTVALAVGSDDDIGVRFQKLNLPPRPLIMDKSHRQCPHHPNIPCFCFEYTTLLDRPEYTGKYLRESPEPEVKTLKVTNGSATAKKKIKLDQYLTKKTTTPRSEQRSSETSPNNATNAPTRSAPSSLPPPPSTANLPAKPPVSHASTPAASRASTNTLSNSSRAPKASIPAKRTADISSNSLKPSSKMPTPDTRPVKRQRISPPPAPPRHLPPPPRRSPPPSRRTPSRRTPPRRTPPRRPATPTLPPLPELLSPTLPKAIEDALAAEESLDDEIIAKPTRDRGTPNGIDRVPPKRSESNKKLPASSSGTPARLSPRPAVSPGKTLPKKPIVGATASKTSGKRPLSPNPVSPRPSKAPATSSKYPASQKSRIVKLKFRKRQKDFQSFVKIAQPKRPRPSQDENGTAKNKAVPGSLNVSKQSTIRSPAFKLPAVKAPKDREVVTPPPKKGNGAVAGKKPDLGGAAITPVSTRDDRNGIARVTPANSQFINEYERFSALGKSSKHEADAVFRSGVAEQKEMRRALVVAADSTMCFVLAFVLQDRCRALENRVPPMEMWRTFIPLSMFVSDKAKALDAPALHGFCKQMEAVVRQHLFDMDMATFSRTSLPENSSKAPTPDSSNPSSNDRNKYISLKGRLAQDLRDLKDCWIDGMKYLTYEEIQRGFPNTYAARSTKWVDPQPQLPKVVGKYKQAFQLPLHRNTTPLEGLNFGRRFLEEWASENGIKYHSKLNEWL